MNFAKVRSTIVIGLFFAVGVFATQTPSRSLSTFEVDRAWPKVLSQWKLGDASSIAIDARDNVSVLHRFRTLKSAVASMAAPPAIVFDTAGNYLKAWGGAAT